MARVFDARVACISPEFTGCFCYNGASTYEFYVYGTITADAANLPTIFFGSLNRDGQLSRNFTCPIIDSLVEFPEQKWALCPIGIGLASSLNNTTSLGNLTASGYSWLMIDLGSISQAEVNVDKLLAWQINSTWEYLNSSKSGPWLQQWNRVVSEDADIQVDYHLQMSWCFDALGGEYAGCEYSAKISDKEGLLTQ